MKEECKYKIIAFVDGERKDIACNAETGCIRKFVWSGIGVRKAAAILLGRGNTENIEAYVEGKCKKQ